MREYFVVGYSNATHKADQGTLITESSHKDAALQFMNAYQDPSGLYMLEVYDSKEAFENHEHPIAGWIAAFQN